jgi:hypothetical protein
MTENQSTPLDEEFTLTDEELRMSAIDRTRPRSRRMAAELLELRARVAELEAEQSAAGKALDKIARYVRPDEDGMWTDADGLLEGIGNAVESTGRKVWDQEEETR